MKRRGREEGEKERGGEKEGGRKEERESGRTNAHKRVPAIIKIGRAHV